MVDVSQIFIYVTHENDDILVCWGEAHVHFGNCAQMCQCFWYVDAKGVGLMGEG